MNFFTGVSRKPIRLRSLLRINRTALLSVSIYRVKPSTAKSTMCTSSEPLP